MVIRTIKPSDNFKKSTKKLDKNYLIRMEKLIKKIIENPEIGKPMARIRKGTRELYLPPFRLSYSYNKNLGEITLLAVYHKDKQ